MDTDEFNMLFVERDSDKKAAANKTLARIGSKSSLVKQQRSVIDMKRGQNGGIALARLKMPFQEVREKVLCMDETALTAEQYR